MGLIQKFLGSLALLSSLPIANLFAQTIVVADTIASNSHSANVSHPNTSSFRFSSGSFSARPLPLREYYSQWKPSSTKAIFYALIPGGGQVYNRKYWKLPIVLGAFTACTYAITWNASTYNDYVGAYRDLLSDDPMAHTSWQAYIPRGADPKDYVQSGELRDRLRRGSDLYRRNRDLSIILAVGLYALSILDAYVDAELYDFDISPDLSMRVMPDYSPRTRFASAGYGLTCRFTLK